MDYLTLLKDFGFPIMVAIFSIGALWKSYNKHEDFLQNVLQTTLKENTEATNKLSQLIKIVITETTKKEGGKLDDDL